MFCLHASGFQIANLHVVSSSLTASLKMNCISKYTYNRCEIVYTKLDQAHFENSPIWVKLGIENRKKGKNAYTEISNKICKTFLWWRFIVFSSKQHL